MSDFWQDKRVLVTGGYGFLGQHLVRQLEAKGCNPFVPRSIDYDLCFPVYIQSMLEDAGQIDILFHLAANVGGIGYNQKFPYSLFYENALMSITLIHQAVSHNVGKFVQIGTTCSYPKHCPTPFQEADLWSGYPEETNAPYGIAKRVLLTQLQAARQQYGFNGIYVIPTNLYGPGDNFSGDDSHVIPALIERIIKAENTVDVWGTGNASRDFLYVEDAAKGIIAAAEKYDEPDPINLGSGQAITIAALVNIIKQITGSEASTVWKVDKPDGQPKRLLDISRAAELLDWQPETNLCEGLGKTIEWYKENYGKS
ncbi:MAG: GDP-L-fucose synthase family protein [Planctomycetota bacterium]